MDTNLAMVIFISIVGFIAMLGILYAISKNNEREKTRREIAAYVAEGSMTPEEGERLLAAGNEHPWKFLWDGRSDCKASRPSANQV